MSRSVWCWGRQYKYYHGQCRAGGWVEGMDITTPDNGDTKHFISVTLVYGDNKWRRGCDGQLIRCCI